MPETLYIVIYEARPGFWKASSSRICTTAEEADSEVAFFERETGMRYAYVKGPICSPEAMAEAEKELAK